MLVAVAVGAVLVGCGSGSDGSADGTAGGGEDRQAFFQVKSTEVCARDETYEFSMTLRFTDNQNDNGNGPFPLSGGWCGANFEVIRGRIYAGDGSELAYFGAGNPDIGKPQVTVKCRPTATDDPSHASKTHRFSERETISLPCSPYRVDVTRNPDTEFKSFSIVVKRA